MDENALELLSQILVFDHNERIKPADVLKHPYFANIAKYDVDVKEDYKSQDNSDESSDQ